MRLNSLLKKCDQEVDFVLKARAEIGAQNSHIKTNFVNFTQEVSKYALKLNRTANPLEFLTKDNFSIRVNSEVTYDLLPLQANTTEVVSPTKTYTTTITVPAQVTGRFAISSYTVGTLDDNYILCSSFLQQQKEALHRDQGNIQNILVSAPRCINAIPDAVVELFGCKNATQNPSDHADFVLNATSCGTLNINLVGACGGFLSLINETITEPNFEG